MEKLFAWQQGREGERMNWQQLFTEQILARGYDYFCDGAVEELECRNHIITATVSGTEDYVVKITLGVNTVKDLYCSCPYAGAGPHCKPGITASN